jgi:hypothetical protein
VAVLPVAQVSAGIMNATSMSLAGVGSARLAASTYSGRPRGPKAPSPIATWSS